jgi:hypothetical protein
MAPEFFKGNQLMITGILNFMLSPFYFKEPKSISDSDQANTFFLDGFNFIDEYLSKFSTQL